MMKKLLLTLSAVAGLMGFAAKAQTVVGPCGTDEKSREIRKLFPVEAAANEAELNRQMEAYVKNMDLRRFAKTTLDGDTLYHVPIVFHVVHEYGSENLSDADIEKCVANANLYYNKKNADTSVIIAPFKGKINNTSVPYIGNTRIMWHLATKDPNGQPTTGVTRRRSYLTSNATDQAKFDQWPSANYMNVWAIGSFSEGSCSGGGLQAYAILPADAATTPYYDGVISLYCGVANGNTIPHELGHTLNLWHTFGPTNNPGINCDDDNVDDTPPTKGHLVPTCYRDSILYDTTCLTKLSGLAKVRVDSVKRPFDTTQLALISDTATMTGIDFGCRTRSVLTSVNFYPTAPIGSTYTIGLIKDGAIINTKSVVSTTQYKPQTAVLNFVVPGGGAAAAYSLCFTQNPGALRDTVIPGLSSYTKGVPGTILMTDADPDSTGYYGFFYSWNFAYGYFKIYGADSLVDYPDTINSQNMMDYAGCQLMFTNGQSVRMRAALSSTVAFRSNLMTDSNLIATGVMDLAGNIVPKPAIAPKADYSVDRGDGLFGTERTYFMCADVTTGKFQFTNRTWRSTPTSISWSLSNGASVPTATTDVVKTSFSTPGWATIQLISTNATGSDTFVTTPGVYVADPVAVDGLHYFQEFNPGTDLDKWPIFNYYNNQFKWELVSNAGYYDKTAIRYRSYDDRFFPNDVTGDPGAGDYDDFFSRGFDLSTLGDRGYLNFMMAGAYATTTASLMRDVLTIYTSSNCGQSWDSLTSIRNADLQTVGSVTGREYVPGPYTDWKPISIDLKSASGTKIRGSKVFFRFRYRPSSTGRFESGHSVMKAVGNNLYIDRINIDNSALSVNEMVLGEKAIGVFPNPTSSNAYVLFKTPVEKANIVVTDVTGKVVYTVSDRIDQNNARVEIPANVISVKGLYLVHITGTEGLNHTEKLVVY